jgi:hypothetical protein
MSSGQVEWSAASGNHSFEVHNCEQFRRMVHFGGWCKTTISIRKWFGQSFPRADSFSPGYTMFSAGGMTQLSEWSVLNNQGQTFPKTDSFYPGCTMFSAEGMAQLGEWSKLINRGQLFFYA